MKDFPLTLTRHDLNQLEEGKMISFPIGRDIKLQLYFMEEAPTIDEMLESKEMGNDEEEIPEHLQDRDGQYPDM